MRPSRGRSGCNNSPNDAKPALEFLADKSDILAACTRGDPPVCELMRGGGGRLAVEAVEVSEDFVSCRSNRSCQFLQTEKAFRSFLAIMCHVARPAEACVEFVVAGEKNDGVRLAVQVHSGRQCLFEAISAHGADFDVRFVGPERQLSSFQPRSDRPRPKVRRAHLGTRFADDQDVDIGPSRTFVSGASWLARFARTSPFPCPPWFRGPPLGQIVRMPGPRGAFLESVLRIGNPV